MDSLSALHWLAVGLAAIALFTWVIPLAIIFRRIGYSPWWGLLGVAPWLGVIALWVLAVVRWPALEKLRTQPPSTTPTSSAARI